MKLYELAYCCRLYEHLTGYDRHLSQLHQRVESGLDPLIPAHRTALFQWLNGWGCRQFAREHHATTASDSLVQWAASWLERLPASPEQLTDLSAARLELCAGAYDALRVLPASRRTLSSGRVSVVTYGPTGTAKTLFALRPNVFPPWDDPIRILLGFGKDGASFQRYLTKVASTLRELAAEAGIPVTALPELVQRPNSSPPKLVDEYNWVVRTKRCPPPTPEEVLRWADWARPAQARDSQRNPADDGRRAT
jgi:hypothetical protein